MRRRGDTLVEVLVALIVLAIVLPSLFSALGTGLLGVSGLRAAGERLYGAEWWFNRLERPVRPDALSAMPRGLPGGGLAFSWTSRKGPHGELWETLTVRSEASGAVLERTRAF